MSGGKKIVGLVIILAIVGIAGAWSLGWFGSSGQKPVAAQGGAAAPDGGTVRIRLSGGWSSLNPPLETTVPGADIEAALYDRLVAVGPKGEIVPYVAKSWEITPTSIKFVLRDDVKCSDGTPMTPSVVANSLKYLFAPTTASTYLTRNFGRGPFSVDADDAGKTLTVNLGSPYSEAIYGFASQTMPAGIICPGGLVDPKAMATQSFGSGPYILKPGNSTPGVSLTVDINPDWKWGPFDVTSKTAGRPKQIIFQVVANDTTAANQLLTGELDAATVGGAEVPRLKENKDLTGFTANVTAGWTLHLNHRTGRPTADKVVREAIFNVIDQKDFIQAAWNGQGIATTSFLIPTHACFAPQSASLIPPMNIDKGRQILVDAGYTYRDGKLYRPDGQPFALRLSGVAGQNHGNGEDYILAQLTKLGATVTMSKVELGTWLKDLQDGNFDVSVVHTSGVTATEMMSTYWGNIPPRGTNYSAIEDEDLAKKVQATFATVGKENCDNVIAVQEALLKNYHVYPLGVPVGFTFARGLSWPITAARSAVNFLGMVRK